MMNHPALTWPVSALSLPAPGQLGRKELSREFPMAWRSLLSPSHGYEKCNYIHSISINTSQQQAESQGRVFIALKSDFINYQPLISFEG